MERITLHNVGWSQSHLQMGHCESYLRFYLTGPYWEKQVSRGKKLEVDHQILRDWKSKKTARIKCFCSDQPRLLWVRNHQRMGMVVFLKTLKASIWKKGSFKHLPGRVWNHHMEVKVTNFPAPLSFPLSPPIWLWLVSWERTRKTRHDASPGQAVSQLSQAGEEGSFTLSDSTTIGLSIPNRDHRIHGIYLSQVHDTLAPLYRFKGMRKLKLKVFCFVF